MLCSEASRGPRGVAVLRSPDQALATVGEGGGGGGGAGLRNSVLLAAARRGGEAQTRPAPLSGKLTNLFKPGFCLQRGC